MCYIISHESVRALADIHELPDHVLSQFGTRPNYVQRQLDGWQARHKKAEVEPLKGMNELWQWLVKHAPPDSTNRIIHNDFKYDNLVLDSAGHHIVAVLDWEMTTRGCPLMDLGVSLGYWLEKDDDPRLRALPFCPTHHDGNLSRDAFVAAYARYRNIDITHPSFYIVYGIWRLIIILGQIYKRYALGHTQDPRFSVLGKALPLLVAHARKCQVPR